MRQHFCKGFYTKCQSLFFFWQFKSLVKCCIVLEYYSQDCLKKFSPCPFNGFPSFGKKVLFWLKTKRFMSELSMKIVKSFQSQFLIYIKQAKGSSSITLVHGTILPKWNSRVKNRAKKTNCKTKYKLESQNPLGNNLTSVTWEQSCQSLRKWFALEFFEEWIKALKL